MMRSMYSGVSGLRIHQTRMDVIGNNIANVNTTGFKSGRVTFNEIFSQTLQGASGASDSLGGRNPMQVGLGANISSIDTLMTEGAAQRTDNPLDMKIEGDGFFIVNSAGGYKFTRAGAFRLDNSGNLVNPEGLNVMGWKVDPTTGNITKGKVEELKILSAENVYSEPQPTKAVTMAGNLDATSSELTPATSPAGNSPGQLVSFTIYDTLGYPYTVDALVQATPTATEYEIIIPADSIKDVNGNTINNQEVNSSSGGLITFDPATGKVNTTVATGFTIKGITGTGYSEFREIDVDFTGLTLFDGKTTADAEAGDVNGLNGGNQAGTISGFDIGTDGQILGKYTNGNTKKLGQIAIATFQNPAGLQKVGNNLFEVTTNSGEFDGIGIDITASGGSLNGGVLEMSNVDLSREFTNMITTQRGFQANSRIITASDEMLQELVNLKR